jgi:hypothetical protein
MTTPRYRLRGATHLYDGDKFLAAADTPEDARQLLAALNRPPPNPNPLHDITASAAASASDLAADLESLAAYLQPPA